MSTERLAALCKQFWRQNLCSHPWKSLIILLLAALASVLLLIFLAVRNQIRLLPVNATSFIEDRNGNYLSEEYSRENEAKGFWKLPVPLPQRIEQAFLAIEDKRYYSHQGIDWKALLRALLKNISGSSRQGASTIAMQLARLQYPTSRSYWKKICEMAIAGGLIQKYGHQTVLQHYLQIVPQGNQIFGVSYAARRYFKKPLQDVSWAEACMLAALPKAPGRFNLFSSKGFSLGKKRAGLILHLLKQQQRIDATDFYAARQQLHYLKPPVREDRPHHSYHAILRLEQELKKMQRLAIDKPLRTTLDTAWQCFLTNLADQHIKGLRSQGAGNIAMIVAETSSGNVRAYLGSEDYFNTEHAGAINYAAIPRSSGSTLKPFIYALGLEKRLFSPGSILPDLPFYITHQSGDYFVSNYDDSFLGPMLYRQALANSRNIPAILVLKAIGLDDTWALLNKLGFRSNLQKPSYYGLGIAIGGLTATLEELLQAYGVLANQGQPYYLKWWNDQSHTSEEAGRCFSEETARQITLFLADPMARLPSFSGQNELDYPFPVAIKTGTSYGYRDAWAIAFSQTYLAAVWIGHADHWRMKKINGLTAAALLKTIMLYLHPNEKHGILENPFPKPSNSKPVKICPLSGYVAGEFCSSAVIEYFSPATMPISRCPVHQSLAIDKTIGRSVTPKPDSATIKSKIMLKLPPEYHAWALKKGWPLCPSVIEKKHRESLQILQPVNNSHIRLDPQTPLQFQTIALQAHAIPAIPEIIWIINGQAQPPSPYPYQLRWPLTPGNHRIQARFPKADVFSQAVTIHVLE